MSGTCVIGLQWGDEAKGKLVDLLTNRFDIVVRYQGGANAGGDGRRAHDDCRGQCGVACGHRTHFEGFRRKRMLRGDQPTRGTESEERMYKAAPASRLLTEPTHFFREA